MAGATASEAEKALIRACSGIAKPTTTSVNRLRELLRKN
jgi:S-adenosylhomocysteine hydrolase